MARTILSRYLDTAGDGTGTKNANGNYASEAEIFYCQPGATEKIAATRMLVSVEDTNGFIAEEYGNLATALTNGVTVRVSDDNGVIVDLTDGIPVKYNAQWGALCYDVDVKTWGNGNELLVARWTFQKAGDFLNLDGSYNERVEVVLNDNLTGLISHYFLLQGQIYYSS